MMQKWPGNLPEDYNNLSNESKQTVDEWIKTRLLPGQSNDSRISSYHLKHIMERENGLYTTNGQFKGAMQQAGYRAFDTNDINWTYKVRVRKAEAQ